MSSLERLLGEYSDRNMRDQRQEWKSRVYEVVFEKTGDIKQAEAAWRKLVVEEQKEKIDAQH